MPTHHITLIDLFKSIVRRYPERTALKDSRRSCSYLELYRGACDIARALLLKDMHPGDRIVCISKKNIESLVCFWGILLGGGIPVMLDHNDGEALNEAKIRKISPRMMILDKADTLPASQQQQDVLLDWNDILAAGSGEVNDFYSGPFPDICYILLTSGTSGEPKAVQISHSNVLHYTHAVYQRIGSPRQVRAAHVSTFSADLGLTNLLMALVSGGMLFILNREEATDPAVFFDIIDNEQISFLKSTPSHFLSLTADRYRTFKHPVDTLMLGGEKLSWTAAQSILSAGVCNRLYNHYGPTETTIGATMFEVKLPYLHLSETNSVPIGTPIGDNCCTIAEAAGELCISGPGVSPGYFEDRQENEKRFALQHTTRYYRTGDICKQLPDGNFEFLYRTDRQIKVRGYRIEPGEIEVILTAHPQVESAIVTSSTELEHVVLDAYIKLISENALSHKDLRAWLSKKMPDYKIPSNIYFYTDPPYNANGKIDLPALKRVFKKDRHQPAERDDSLAESPWPVVVKKTWESILGITGIRDTDNFFEIGGDSLLAIQLIGRLQRYGFKVHISYLNNHPSFGDFVSLEPEKSAGDSAGTGSRATPRCFTVSQQQFLQHRHFDLNFYVQSILLETAGKIGVKEMAFALHCVLKSHVYLTNRFPGDTVSILERDSRNGSHLKVSVLDETASVVVQIREEVEKLHREISIERGKLLVAQVFIDPQGKEYLYLACHHLVVDVISWNIIIDELLDFYQEILQGRTPKITAEDAIHRFFSRDLDKAAADQQPVLPVIRLPRPAPDADITGLPEVYSMRLPEKISCMLKELHEANQPFTLGGVLTGGLAHAVLEHFSIPEVTIDVEFHGRPQHPEAPDLSRSVAWWATTMPLHFRASDLSPESCAELLKERSLEANNLNLFHSQWQAKTYGQADIRFNYLGHFPDSFGNASLQLKPSPFNAGSTRSAVAHQEFLLYFTCRFIGASLVVDIQYQPKMFSLSAVHSIADTFFTFLKRCLWKAGADIDTCALSVLESNIPSVGQPLYHLNYSAPVAGKVVLLTGATGFQGSHLLRELIRHNDMEVYCVVRGKSQSHAEARLESVLEYYFDHLPGAEKSRIKVVRGDVALDHLGMEKAMYEEIARRADLIFHVAADTNLNRHYADLTRSNVTATKHVIELSGTGKVKEIHYVSTLAVSGYSPDGFKVFSEADFNYGQRFISNYEKTKFEAEKLVREFLRKGGKGKIYRVGHIAAGSVNGKFQCNIDQNRIFQIIKGILLLKQIPDVYTESLSFSYVDIVAKGLALLGLGVIDSPAPCFHLENPQYFSFINIAEMLQQIGYDIRIVSLSVFKQSVARFAGDTEDQKLVATADLWIQRFIDFPRQVTYSQRCSLDTIARSGIYFPGMTLEWFMKMINEGVKASYFPLPEASGELV